VFSRFRVFVIFGAWNGRQISMTGARSLVVVLLLLGACRSGEPTDSTRFPIDLLAEPQRLVVSTAPGSGAPEGWSPFAVGEWGFENGTGGWWVRVYRGNGRGGPTTDSARSGTHAFCLESVGGQTDADAQIHLDVEPSTDYRLEGDLRTFDLEPASARVYGGFYLGEFSYRTTDETDANDPVRWHPGLPKLRGTTPDWQRVVYDFRTTPQTKMVRLAVSLGNWGGSTGKICFDDVRLAKPRSEEKSGAGAEVRLVEIGNELKRALVAHPRSELRYALRPPANARLSFETATTAATGDGVVFRVDARDGDRTDALFSRHVQPASRLVPPRSYAAEVSLASYAGRSVEIVLHTEPSAAGEDFDDDRAYWIAPSIYVERDAEARRAEPNIFLVTVDTLRADHLRCYGYPRDTSPAIDRFAAHSILFENAFTTIPRTTPALASMVTGLYPRRHGLMTLLDRLDDSQRTIAEVLKERGYDTAAFVTHNVSRVTGLQQGFDTYADHYRVLVNDPASGAEQVARGALDWVSEHAGRKMFVWLHVWDPHFRYQAPPPYERWFDSAYADTFDLYERLDRDAISLGQVFFRNDLTPRQLEHAIARYDGEIRYTDEIVGQFLDALRNLGLYDDSLVVFTADHGESLGEHGYFFEHGEYLYDGTLRIPLIAKFPSGRISNQRIPGKVMIQDVAPTILAAAGGALPDSDGQDLALFLDGKREAHPVTFAETDRSFYPENPRRPLRGLAGNWKSIRSGRWKLIQIPTRDGPTFELYDTTADPAETKNLYDQQRAEAEPLAKELDAWLASFESRRGPATNQSEETKLDNAAAERLRALGYMNAQD
jgi:arylsulfatase A-like enzyme